MIPKLIAICLIGAGTTLGYAALWHTSIDWHLWPIAAVSLVSSVATTAIGHLGTRRGW